MASQVNVQRHQAHVKSLYRSLLRGLYKAGKHDIAIGSDAECASNIAFEVRKAAVNPGLYKTFLLSELRYYINENIRRRSSSSINTYMALEQAERLAQSLEALEDKPSQPSHWHQVMGILVELRDKSFQQQKWKEAYRKNRDAIDEQRVKDLPSKMVQKLGASRGASNVVGPVFNSLPANQRTKEYKKATTTSKDDAGFVVRNYLKKLQLEGRIPNPYKLPYVSDTLTYQSANITDPSVLLPGSTKTFVLEQAYDKNYIEAIIKPEVEYLINQSILDEIDDQINQKGPPKVKIQATNAGVTRAYYIGPPFSDPKAMKEIAVEIKRSTRLYKLQHVWNLKASNKSASAHEKKVGNGFAVRGSGGFSEDEVIYTREYYETLADAEAKWEALMDEVRSEHLTAKRPHKRKELSYKQAWREPLDIASSYIETELMKSCERCKLSPDTFKQQKELQESLNEKFEEKASRYAELVKQLKKDDVFMHSEIVNFRNPVETTAHDSLQEDSLRRPKYKQGIAEVERKHMGKKLGDYLAQFKFRSFSIGRRFRERFKF